MKNIRISTTMLDQYRKYNDGVINYDTLLNYITGEYEPTVYMQYGKAFHKILEKPDVYYNDKFDYYIADNIEFDKKLIDTVLKKLPPGPRVNELKTTKEYLYNSYNITLVGKVDSIYGRVLYEYKTTWHGFKFDNYYHSIQWRCYLVLFGVNIINYIVYDMKLKKSGVDLKDIHTFLLTPSVYEKNGEIVKNTLHDFVDMLDKKELINYFEVNNGI